MHLATSAKRFSIQTGLYRPARWLSRLVKPADGREFKAQVDFYRRLLPSGSLCFDVGANVGSKSEALLGAGHRVIAFEPNPDVLPELRARCGHHPSWTLLQVALGSAPSVLTLFSRRSSGQSGMVENWDGATDIIAEHQVPTLTLDTLITRFGCPGFLKIDVEGWEVEVLKGLTQPVPMVAFEFHTEPEDLDKARLCLERLDRPNVTVNLVDGEGDTFVWAQWMPMTQLLEIWRIDPRRAIGEMGYGDLFVRS